MKTVEKRNFSTSSKKKKNKNVNEFENKKDNMLTKQKKVMNHGKLMNNFELNNELSS